jgi:8-oxo-dGTP pyrophosphatase MutT (NUDIX family)
VTDPIPLPAAMVARAREFRGPPAPARAAATVVLLRHNPDLEVYVLRRAATMAFGGVYAFPGGGVDPSDRPETVRDDWPRRLGVPGEQAKAVVGAAARELFEEAGVLLAGPAPADADGVVGAAQRAAGSCAADGIVGDLGGDGWEADRVAVAARARSMTELLARRGLRLRDDLLQPWARWITPEFEPRRFDTWFFVAALPDGQAARDVSGEADRTAWVSPAAADGLAMLPPTRVLVTELRAYRRIEEVFAAAGGRDAARPVVPRVELTADGRALLHVSRSGR